MSVLSNSSCYWRRWVCMGSVAVRPRGHCRCGAAREEWEVQNDGGALHLCTSPVLGDKGKKTNKQQLYGENKKAMLKLLYKSSCKGEKCISVFLQLP